MDIEKYTGIETLDMVLRNVHAIYEHGTPENIPDRFRDLELERRRTTIKYKCKTLRVVIAKTRGCFTIVTVFPYPGKTPDIMLT